MQRFSYRKLFLQDHDTQYSTLSNFAFPPVAGELYLQCPLAGMLMSLSTGIYSPVSASLILTPALSSTYSPNCCWCSLYQELPRWLAGGSGLLLAWGNRDRETRSNNTLPKKMKRTILSCVFMPPLGPHWFSSSYLCLCLALSSFSICSLIIFSPQSLSGRFGSSLEPFISPLRLFLIIINICNTSLKYLFHSNFLSDHQFIIPLCMDQIQFFDGPFLNESILEVRVSLHEFVRSSLILGMVHNEQLLLISCFSLKQNFLLHQSFINRLLMLSLELL